MTSPARTAGPAGTGALARAEAPRLLALGGIVGPAMFVGAWSVLGAVTDGYSPVHDAISRLAAMGAPTRPAMTVGLVGFGVALPLYAVRLRRAVPGPAWVAASVAGLAALGVAATPLDPPAGATAHGVFASVSYGAVAALPLLARRGMAARGGPAWRAFSTAAGVLSGAFLVATTAGVAPGLCQRVGLTVGDVWIVASAAHLLRRP